MASWDRIFTLVLVCSAFLPVASASENLTGAFGIEFRTPLPIPQEVALLAPDVLDYIDFVPPGTLQKQHPGWHRDVPERWIHLVPPDIPKVLREWHTRPEFFVLVDDKLVPVRVQAVVELRNIGDCDTWLGTLEEVLSRRYRKEVIPAHLEARPDYPIYQRYSGELNLVELRCRRDFKRLYIDYIDVSGYRSWLAAQLRQIRRWNKVYWTGIANELADADSPYLDKVFGVEFGEFVPQGLLGAETKDGFELSPPAPWARFADHNPRYEVELTSEGKPLSIRGRGKFRPEEQAALKQLLVDAFRTRFGGFRKNTERHSVMRVKNVLVVLKAWPNGDLELAYIDREAMRHRTEVDEAREVQIKRRIADDERRATSGF